MRIDPRLPPLSHPLKLFAVYGAVAIAAGLLFLIGVTVIARPWILGIAILAYAVGVLTARFWRHPDRINHAIARLLHQM